MAGMRLPTMPTHDVATHDSEESCYVTVGANVYDVTTFLCDHPGGGDLILEYGGKDVSDIMGDELFHVHSEAAYEILKENMIGFVANEATVKTAVEHDPPKDIVPIVPKAVEVAAVRAHDITAMNQREPVFTATKPFGAKDLTKEADQHADYEVHRFLNPNKPLLAQVWNGKFSKDFYLQQVYRPRYYSLGESAPLFGNFLEPLSTTAWYVVPLVWLPPAIWGTFLANQGMPSIVRTAQYVLSGLVLWSLVEYGVHRAVFHMDQLVLALQREVYSPCMSWLTQNASYLPDNRIGITLHFVLHGLHHYLPMEKYRLVTPPLVFVFLAPPFYRLAHLLFYWDWHAATAIFCGGLFGYVHYEIVHYHLHHKTYVIHSHSKPQSSQMRTEDVF